MPDDTRPPLVALRVLAGFATQESLAKFIGVTDSLVCYWESGSRKPSLSTSRAYAKALGVTVDQLLDAIDRNEQHMKEK